MRGRGTSGLLTITFLLAGCGPAFEDIRSAPTLAAALARSSPQPTERRPAPEPATMLSRVFPQATQRHAAFKVTGQLFVRFTPEAAAAVEQTRRSAGPPHVGIGSLDQLLGTYGVVRIEPVFSSQSTLHSGEGETGSNDIYLLDLATDRDRASIVRAFNDDPAVVYAEPKYLPEEPLVP